MFSHIDVQVLRCIDFNINIISCLDKGICSSDMCGCCDTFFSVNRHLLLAIGSVCTSPHL